jgi:ribosomal-protein-alanine N-acetyltransferase
MQFETIETERLLLRKITPEIRTAIFTQYPDNEARTWFGLQTDEDYAREKEKVQKGLTTFNRSFLYFMLVDKTSNETIGWCGYHTWYTDHRRAEIGYGLNEDVYKAKGLMSEAIRPILDYGFEHMNLNRIEAFIGPFNQASIRLVEKFHFVHEGLLRQHYIKGLNIEDSLVYSLLREEHVKAFLREPI